MLPAINIYLNVFLTDLFIYFQICNQLKQEFQMTKPQLEHYVRLWSKEPNQDGSISLNEWMALLHNAGKVPIQLCTLLIKTGNFHKIFQCKLPVLIQTILTMEEQFKHVSYFLFKGSNTEKK